MTNEGHAMTALLRTGLLAAIVGTASASLQCGKDVQGRADDTVLRRRAPNISLGSVDCKAGDGIVRISEKCIGDLVVDSSVGHNARLHSAQFDTLVYGHESEESTSAYPSVGFVFRHLKAVGLQYGDTLRRDQPADAWIIVGSEGELPRQVPLRATWQQLKQAYGRAVGNAEYDVTVTFCSYPAFQFTLTADPAKVGSIEATKDLSPIPDSSRIAHVLLLSARLASWKRC